jgi:hypothetical protein
MKPTTMHLQANYQLLIDKQSEESASQLVQTTLHYLVSWSYSYFAITSGSHMVIATLLAANSAN